LTTDGERTANSSHVETEGCSTGVLPTRVQPEPPGGDETPLPSSAMSTVNVCELVRCGFAPQRSPPDADSVNVYWPAATGVPLKSPLRLFIERPAGVCPSMNFKPRLQPTSLGYHELLKVKEYPEPWVPLPGVLVIGSPLPVPPTTSSYCMVAMAFVESCTWTMIGITPV
jgi:hypothetical protein